MVAGIGELTRHPVDDIRRHRGQRDHHTRRTGRPECSLHVVEVAETAATAAWSEVVRPDEADGLIAELRPALRGVQQADGVGIRADDDDASPDPALPAHAGKHPAGDRPLDHERHQDQEQDAHHPEPGEDLELADEGEADDRPHADQGGVEQALQLLAAPLDGPRLIQLVGRQGDHPHRERPHREHEVVALHAELGLAAHQRLEDEGEEQAERDGDASAKTRRCFSARGDGPPAG